MYLRQRGFLSVVGWLFAPLLLVDVAVGLVKLLRAFKRRRHVDASGALVSESLPIYRARLYQAVRMPLIVFVLLAIPVAGFLLILYFGPLRPVHEWVQ
jgi:hypothetical protein